MSNAPGVSPKYIHSEVLKDREDDALRVDLVADTVFLEAPSGLVALDAAAARRLRDLCDLFLGAQVARNRKAP